MKLLLSLSSPHWIGMPILPFLVYISDIASPRWAF